MTGFGLDHLPYGIVSRPGGVRHAAVRFEDSALLLAPAQSLNELMVRGPSAWSETRSEARERIERGDPELVPLDELDVHLPFAVADYVDFYSSLEHATNMGRMFRPDAEPLLPNWRHLPVGYHGRSGSVVPSGTPVVRPCGQAMGPGEASPGFGPSRRLDIELELGFVVGVPSRLGEPVPPSAFREHVFGVVLVNDWSARDIQAWEYQPLGPFLGKSFATSVAAWVTPLEALDRARVAPPAQEPEPLPYLRSDESWALDLALEVELNGEVVSRTNARSLYWTMPQQLAHATVNGASVRTGDLFASGTISGAAPDAAGSLIELTWNGERPLRLRDGSERTFLQDGDEVVLRGASGELALAEVRGRIWPARCQPPRLVA